MVGLGIALGNAGCTRWWPEGACYAASFAENRYMRDGAPLAAASAIGFSRASGKYAADRAGTWHAFAANEAPRTNSGILLEAAAENGLGNTAFAGAAISTTDALDGLPTGWSKSKIGADGFYGRILALDSWQGLPAATIRLWGNSSISDAQIAFNGSSAMAAVFGDTILESIFMQQLAGSMSNIACKLRLTEQSAADQYLNKQLGSVTPSTDGGRPAGLFTIGQANAAKAVMGLEFTATGAFDVTLRIAAPQLVKSSSGMPTSPIISNLPAVRAADALTLKLPETDCQLTLTFADGSTIVKAAVSGDVSLDPAEFGGVPLREAVAVPV